VAKLRAASGPQTSSIQPTKYLARFFQAPRLTVDNSATALALTVSVMLIALYLALWSKSLSTPELGDN